MPANAPFVIPVKPVLDLIGERESRPAARSRAGHRAGLKALSVAAGTLTRPTISGIQKPVSSIGLSLHQNLQRKLDKNFKILVY
jgi:hypothetical protein